MGKAMGKFVEVTKDPYTSLAEWKERNKKKVIGCFPMHLPEEMVHAAGMLPVVIWRSNELVTFGHAHMLPWNCGLCRSFIDDAVKGKLGFMDGMIFYGTCTQAHGMAYIIERNVHPAYLEHINLAAMITSPVTKDNLVENLEKLRASLEKFSGQKITTQSLKQSIILYNKNRGLLRKLYDLRRANPGLLKAKEVLSIVQASMLMPKEEHNELLEQLLPELERREAARDGRVRVILSGNLCQTPRADILDLIEDMGAVVIDDEIYTGSRYFANDVEVNDNPIESLADRFLKRTPPCPTKVDWETDWSDYIIEMVRKDKAQGVITFLVKYCPPHMCYYPDVKRRLAEAGIPELLIEMEHEAVSLEGVKTRLQAFSEVIGGA